MASKKNKTAQKLNTDIILFILTPIVFISGIVTFLVFHPDSQLWHTWMNIHAFSSLLMTIAIVFHIIHHWGWYKKNWLKFKQSIGRMWLLSVSFILTCLTGLYILLFSESYVINIEIYAHMTLGMIALGYVVWHIVKFFPVIKGWIKRKVKK